MAATDGYDSTGLCPAFRFNITNYDQQVKQTTSTAKTLCYLSRSAYLCSDAATAINKEKTTDNAENGHQTSLVVLSVLMAVVIATVAVISVVLVRVVRQLRHQRDFTMQRLGTYDEREQCIFDLLFLSVAS